jgi:ribosomal protein S18 acetylase RimI-like enzyme
MAYMISFKKAGIADIDTIRALAFKIWPPTYTAILSPPQMEYMLNMMYSKTSLQKQIEQQQHTFILIYHNKKPAGFASYSLNKNFIKSSYTLHKIYVLPQQQGVGLGKKIIEYIINDIILLGAKTIELNVNRNNKAKGFYEKLGFRIIKEEDIDIGNGYFMNDFVMEKIL